MKKHFMNDDGTCESCIQLGVIDERKRLAKIIKDLGIIKKLKKSGFECESLYLGDELK